MRIQPPGDGFELARLAETTAPNERKYENKVHWVKRDGLRITESIETYFDSVYGVRGDRLWVRETFLFRGNDNAVVYRADYEAVNGATEAAGFGGMYGGWRPSIFMPRWASRIMLEITDVRAQRLQKISEEDAVAEGVEKLGEFPDITPWRNYALKPRQPHCLNFSIARRSFETLWDSINRKRGHGWHKNPWVFALTFRRVSA